MFYIDAKPKMQLVKLSHFALVGCLGFIVDALIFFIGFQLVKLDMMTARVIAFLFAASTTWLGNRLLTFKEAEKSNMGKQWQKFLAAATISALPNLLVFRMTSSLLSTVEVGAYIALVTGVFAGMLSNFYLNDRWVFKS